MSNPLNFSMALLLRLFVGPRMESVFEDSAEDDVALSEATVDALLRWLTREVIAMEHVPSMLRRLRFRRLVARLAAQVDGDVAAWLVRRLEACRASPDGVVDALEELRLVLEANGAAALFDEASPNRRTTTRFDPRSVFGVFVRRTVASLAAMHFDGIARLYDQLQVYLDDDGDDDDDHDGDHRGMDEDGGGGGIVGGGLLLARADERMLSFLTPDQLELYLEQSAERISRSIERGAPYEATEAEIAALIAVHPAELPRAHFLRYLNCAHHREFQRALDSLHRYFDSALVSSRPRVGSSAGAAASVARQRGVVQHAILNVAALHFRFGHRDLAALAIDEAVRVAQQRRDHACVTYALSWLHVVMEDARDDPRDAEDVLRRAADRSHHLGLAELNVATRLTRARRATASQANSSSSSSPLSSSTTAETTPRGHGADLLRCPVVARYQPTPTEPSAAVADALRGSSTASAFSSASYYIIHRGGGGASSAGGPGLTSSSGSNNNNVGPGGGGAAAPPQQATNDDSATARRAADLASHRHLVAAYVWATRGHHRLQTAASHALLLKTHDDDAPSRVAFDLARANAARALLCGDALARRRSRLLPERSHNSKKKKKKPPPKTAYALALRTLFKKGSVVPYLSPPSDDHDDDSDRRLLLLGPPCPETTATMLTPSIDGASNVTSHAAATLLFEAALSRGDTARSRALAGVLAGVSPPHSDLGTPAHVAAALKWLDYLVATHDYDTARRCLNQLLACLEKNDDRDDDNNNATAAKTTTIAGGGGPPQTQKNTQSTAIKAASKSLCSSSEDLRHHHANALLFGAALELEAAPHAPINALPNLLRCLALCERFAMDAKHAEATMCLAALHVRLGSLARAKALSRAALPKVLEHCSIEAQGDAWMVLCECELLQSSHHRRSRHTTGGLATATSPRSFGAAAAAAAPKKKVPHATAGSLSDALRYLRFAVAAFAFVDHVAKRHAAHYLEARICAALPGEAMRRERNRAARDYAALGAKLTQNHHPDDPLDRAIHALFDPVLG